MSKRPRPLPLLSVIAALLLTACTRFIGTLPSPAGTPDGQATPDASSAAPTATLPPAVLPASDQRATVSEVVNTVEAKPSAGAAYAPVQDGAVIGVGGQVR